MLAQVEHNHPCELRADFQQYYGLNLDLIGTAYSYEHAAILVEQLPRGSRVISALEPKVSWTDTEYLLSAIEYDLRVLAWQNTKDAQKGRNKPKPPIHPEHALTEPLATREQMQSVASALGISLEGVE